MAVFTNIFQEKRVLDASVISIDPLTFTMTVSIFTENIYRVKGPFFNKIRLLVIYIL